MEPDLQLQRAIDKCYDIFAKYPRPDKLDASPLRDSLALLRNLTSAPLPQLDGEHIGPYAGYALTTVGDVSDYKHFLPRILEVAVHRSLWSGTEPAIIAERLKLGKWRDWPIEEQRCVCDIFVAAWQQALEEHPNQYDAMTWLCGIAILELDVSSALKNLSETQSINMSLQLANFLTSTFFEVEPGERGYWGYVGEERVHLIRNWVMTDQVLEKLTAARTVASTADLWMIEGGLRGFYQLRLSRLQ